MNLQDMSLEDALNQIMTANTLTFKVIGPRTIFVYADSQANRQKYEDQFVQTFYISNSDPQEIVQIVTQILGTSGPAIRPIIYPNKTANAIRSCAPPRRSCEVIAGIIQSNDKPRAEVMIDVEILEVDRNRAKDLGLELSNYSLGFSFSPEVAPPNTSGTFPPGVPPPFNLNTISAGVSAADFYMTVPSAQIHLLERTPRRSSSRSRRSAVARTRKSRSTSATKSRSRRRRSCRWRRAARRRSRRCPTPTGRWA